MPFQYFTGSSLKFIPANNVPEQSENPFAPNYVKPRGKYYYPPEYFEIRPTIIKKYNDRCFLCGELGYEVHHIDYDKMHCTEDNLVLLCKNCHAITGGNREYWQEFFKNKIGHDKEI
jgi:hypothetical protein